LLRIHANERQSPEMSGLCCFKELKFHFAFGNKNNNIFLLLACPYQAYDQQLLNFKYAYLFFLPGFQDSGWYLSQPILPLYWFPR